jgi:hypothetical protein
MDVIKAAIKLGQDAEQTQAIKSDGICHTYAHLLRHALSVAIELESTISAQNLQVCSSLVTQQGYDHFTQHVKGCLSLSSLW